MIQLLHAAKWCHLIHRNQITVTAERNFPTSWSLVVAQRWGLRLSLADELKNLISILCSSRSSVCFSHLHVGWICFTFFIVKMQIFHYIVVYNFLHYELCYNLDIEVVEVWRIHLKKNVLSLKRIKSFKAVPFLETEQKALSLSKVLINPIKSFSRTRGIEWLKFLISHLPILVCSSRKFSFIILLFRT